MVLIHNFFLPQVNKDLAKRTKELEDSEQNLRKRLNIEQSSEPPKKAISEKQKKAYRTQRDEMFQLWQEALRVNEMREQIQIQVKHKFKLWEYFDILREWTDEENMTFLFVELDGTNCGLWLKKWNVRYYHGK